ncbi:hypothetical protein EDD22DRAFT_967852 [Suillus occidentalis]|nr:hypothetical protein EDD22DRAFT_967852 [Suillus occidentalis]
MTSREIKRRMRVIVNACVVDETSSRRKRPILTFFCCVDSTWSVYPSPQHLLVTFSASLFRMIKTLFNPRSKSAKTRADIKAEEAAEIERLKALRAQKELAAFGTDYQWLKGQGYLLRPQYGPDWVPSWEASKRDPLACEGGQVLRFGRIMDATRLSDGLYVSLKVIKKSEHPHEAEIGRNFMKVELASDSKNHCVPFLDVLSVPGEDNTQIIVMPLLLDFSKLPFDSFGEVVEMLRQLFEGLLFMHKYRVAHCDFMWMNIMMDAKDIYVEPYHPIKPHMKRDFSGNARHRTRTQRPPNTSLSPVYRPFPTLRQVPPDFFDNVQDRDPSSTTGRLHPDFSSHT